MQGSSLKADSLPAGSQAKEERIWVAWGMRGGGGVCVAGVVENKARVTETRPLW